VRTPTLGSRRPSGGRPGGQPGAGRGLHAFARASPPSPRLGTPPPWLRRPRGSRGRNGATEGSRRNGARYGPREPGSGPRRRTGRGAAHLAPPSEGGEPAAPGGTPLAPPPSLPRLAEEGRGQGVGRPSPRLDSSRSNRVSANRQTPGLYARNSRHWPRFCLETRFDASARPQRRWQGATRSSDAEYRDRGATQPAALRACAGRSEFPNRT